MRKDLGFVGTAESLVFCSFVFQIETLYFCRFSGFADLNGEDQTVLQEKFGTTQRSKSRKRKREEINSESTETKIDGSINGEETRLRKVS